MAERHEKVRDIVQTIAVLITGVWVGSVWLYDNWASQYLGNPYAEMKMSVADEGRLASGDRYVIVRIAIDNQSPRAFFQYANTLTVRALEIEPRLAPGFEINEMTALLTEQAFRGQTWTAERYVTRGGRNPESVLAYGQFAPLGYKFTPGESYSVDRLVVVPPETEAISLYARLNYGVAESLFEPHSEIHGGGAIAANGEMVACIPSQNARWDFQTPCQTDYKSSEDATQFYMDSTYAQRDFVFAPDTDKIGD